MGGACSTQGSDEKWIRDFDRKIEGSRREALGYRLEDRGSRVRVPAGAGDFPLLHRLQNGCGAHPASYPMETRGFPWVKAAGA
jgi:hypothetical protein